MFVEEAVVVVPVNSTLPEKPTLPVNVCPDKASDLSSEADTALAAISLESTAPAAMCLASTWSVAIFAEVTLLSAIFAVVILPAAI